MGKLATEDYRKALVFKKNGIDFCCGGKRTLVQATKEKSIDHAPVQMRPDFDIRKNQAPHKSENRVH